MKRPAVALLGLVLFAAGWSSGGREEPPRVSPNDNRRPAGTMWGDTLVLRLVVRTAEWYPEADDGPHIMVEAFAEEGKAPSVPAPLIRARTGTPVRVMVRNALPDSTIHVIGLGTHPVPLADTLHVGPGSSAEVVFRAGAPGTYLYRAVIGYDPDGRPSERETAGGAFVVDPAEGSPPDRVFVLNLIATPVDSIRVRNALAINGRAWPHTERVVMTVGDTARWRVVNATARTHPMHLHGFYFRVDASGDGRSSREIPGENRRLGVTEPMPPWNTRTLTWSPDRAGNWLFHCHLAFHVTPQSRLYDGPRPASHSHSADPSEHMAGLVLGISVAGKPGSSDPIAGPARRVDLHFLQGAPRGRMSQTFSYVLQEGATPPRADSVAIPGSLIVVHRGEPVDVVIHNRSREGVGIHWHGIELESWSDGVVGWSGAGKIVAPPVEPGDSFRARLLLPRAGTFMYHTHMNDIEQITHGAAAPLIVLEPGERFDPRRDHVYLVQWHGEPAPLTNPALLINGDSVESAPKELALGATHRFRLINIGAAGAVRFSLRRDTSLAEWRALAKDGADLATPLRVIQPATQVVFIGETWDFEFTPSSPGTYELVAAQNPVPGFRGAPIPWRQRIIVTPAPTDLFWTRLTALCGKAFEGRAVEVPAGDTTFTNRALIMHVRDCGTDTIRIPFHVGSDRSRTWVITRSESGLRLKHDHRHEDGAPDSVTQYGGDARVPGSPGVMEFPADSFTATLIPAARTNIWTLEVDPNRGQFVYALRREGTNRRFRIEFDLRRPVPAPPPPW